MRSADLQSTASPICIRLGTKNAEASITFKPLRIKNPRFGRLQIRATTAS